MEYARADTWLLDYGRLPSLASKCWGRQWKAPHARLSRPGKMRPRQSKRSDCLLKCQMPTSRKAGAPMLVRYAETAATSQESHLRLYGTTSVRRPECHSRYLVPNLLQPARD